jgi:hypothetical protein
MITGPKLYVNPKGFRAYEAPNRLSAMLTTNHAHAVHAGSGARRWFVIQSSREQASNHKFFAEILTDLDAGGYGQLLNWLLRMKLGSWHPRQIIRTKELAEQQLRSAGHIEQWLLACSEHDCVPGYDNGKISSFYSLELDKTHPSTKLHEHFVSYAKSNGFGRIDGAIVGFSKSLTAILGEDAHTRVYVEDNASKSKTRRQVRAFKLPGAGALRKAVEQSLGVTTHKVEPKHDGPTETWRDPANTSPDFKTSYSDDETPF